MRHVGSARAIVLDWTERGAIRRERLREALAVARATPATSDWRWFLDRLLLWSGAFLLSSAALFFIAFNWTTLGRFTRFGLVEALILASVLTFYLLDPDKRTAKAALLFGSMVMGGLLALYGQTYQTGADTWQLFAGWALLILPWVLAGRFAPLWMLWLVVTNLAIALYFVVVPRLLGILISVEREVWTLFLFDTFALLVWELADRRVTWLEGRWAPRLLMLATGCFITVLANGAIIGAWKSPIAGVVYLGWLACVTAIYRRHIVDLFMIAAACLSLIITVPVYLTQNMMNQDNAGSILVVGLIVIGMSAAAAFWLKTLAQEQQL